MTKLLPLILFLVMFTNVQVYASQKATHQETDNTNYIEENFEEPNFDNHSFYISDEQLQDAQEIDEIDDKSSFLQKVINSSHFSSDTATRTWIPINKVQE